MVTPAGLGSLTLPPTPFLHDPPSAAVPARFARADGEACRAVVRVVASEAATAARFVAVYPLSVNTAALHDGSIVQSLGHRGAEVRACLAGVLPADPQQLLPTMVLVVDRAGGAGWVASFAEAVEFAKRWNQ